MINNSPGRTCYVCLSSNHLHRLGRNRLQEESAMLPLKNKPNILELA